MFWQVLYCTGMTLSASTRKTRKHTHFEYNWAYLVICDWLVRPFFYLYFSFSDLCKALPDKPVWWKHLQINWTWLTEDNMSRKARGREAVQQNRWKESYRIEVEDVKRWRGWDDGENFGRSKEGDTLFSAVTTSYVSISKALYHVRTFGKAVLEEEIYKVWPITRIQKQLSLIGLSTLVVNYKIVRARLVLNLFYIACCIFQSFLVGIMNDGGMPDCYFFYWPHFHCLLG